MTHLNRLCLMWLPAVLLAFLVSHPASAGDGDIVISEVAYNATCQGTDDSTCGSSGGEKRFEWVEIFNKGSAAVNINGWQICDNNDCDPLPDRDIGPGEYWIVAYNISALQTEFNQYSPPFTVDASRTIFLTSPIGGGYGLANRDGDRVYLLNAAGDTVDCISWAPTAGTFCGNRAYVSGGGGFDSYLNNAKNGQSITNIQGTWYEHGPSDKPQQASPYQPNTAVGNSPTAVTLTAFTAEAQGRPWVGSNPPLGTLVLWGVMALVGFVAAAGGARLRRR